MSDSPTLGTMIRERRLEQGLSLGQLATKLGHTSASVRRWERGEDVPSNALIVRIADALDLDETDLRAAPTVTPAAAAPPVGEAKPTAKPEPETAQAASGADQDETPEPQEHELPREIVDESPEAPAPTESTTVTDGEPEPAEEPQRAEEPEPGSEPDRQPKPVSELVDQKATPAAEAAPPKAETVLVEAIPKPEVAAEEAPPAIAPEAPKSPVVAEPAARARDDRPLDITEAPTEAVPVVTPPRPTGTTPPTPSAATRAIPARPTMDRPSFQNPFAVLFDPEQRWLYWIRLSLLIIAGLVLLYTFVWAVGEFWDSLGELLDTFGSTEEVSDVVEN